MLPQKWCMVDKACCSAADMPSIECSTGVEANHGGAAGAVVLVQTILDHVGFAGLDVDARRAVTPKHLARSGVEKMSRLLPVECILEPEEVESSLVT